jgi:hypothetical protein
MRAPKARVNRSSPKNEARAKIFSLEGCMEKNVLGAVAGPMGWEQSGNIQGIFREHSGNIQGELRKL